MVKAPVFVQKTYQRTQIMVCAVAKQWMRHSLHIGGVAVCQLTFGLVTVGWGAADAEDVEGIGAGSSS